MAGNVILTGEERFFDDDELIVSKTDLTGRITYANDVFLRISGYREQEILGQPHSIIRHPDMPRCIVKLLWDTLGQGKEVFAYVVNRCRNGDHYWVFAHVTPSRDMNGNVIGYHSNRRVPEQKIVTEEIIPLYKKLRETEAQHNNRKEGMNAGSEQVVAYLESQGVPYDEFVLTVGQNQRRGFR